MAKKLGRPRKKKINHLYTFDPVMNEMGVTNPVATNPVATEKPRASDSSYVFVCGNKVLIRSLTDELLNEKYEQTFISATEARRLANNLESLEFNLSMEQRYRGLK